MKKALGLSTICISAALVATSIAAQSIPTGCFARDYSQAHLASHPDQVVESMWLQIIDNSAEGLEPSFTITALMADQGHAGRDGLGGMVLSESGSCWNGQECMVYCDGGGFAFTHIDPTHVEITTRHMRVVESDACEGGDQAVATLAEQIDHPTTYRLFRKEDWVCERH